MILFHIENFEEFWPRFFDMDSSKMIISILLHFWPNSVIYARFWFGLESPSQGQQPR